MRRLPPSKPTRYEQDNYTPFFTCVWLAFGQSDVCAFRSTSPSTHPKPARSRSFSLTKKTLSLSARTLSVLSLVVLLPRALESPSLRRLPRRNRPLPRRSPSPSQNLKSRSPSKRANRRRLRRLPRRKSLRPPPSLAMLPLLWATEKSAASR